MVLQHTHNPLSYKEWKSHYEDSFDASELPILYNNYLTEWKTEKLQRQSDDDLYVKNTYTQFLKNINLSTIDNNIVRFLDRIKTNNIYELELAVHYYSVIIKDQLKNVRNLREELKFTKIKNKLKSSKIGITNYLKNFIIRLLDDNTFVTEGTKTLASDINLPKIANNFTVNLNTYASDEFVYNFHKVDKNLILNIPQRVIDEVPNISQVLAVNTNGRVLKVTINNIGSLNSTLSINQPFSNYERLPVRYFKDEEKTLSNLKFIIERDLIRKYVSNDLYYINSVAKEVNKLFEHTNTTNNLSQRYSPNLFKQLINIKHNEIYPQQLSFFNTGVTVFHSSNLTYSIELSSLRGHEYILPDPSKFESGVKCVGDIKNSTTGQIIRNIYRKRKPPFKYKAKNAQFKNDNINPGVNIYNNKLLRNYGYQSKENSLDYSFTGINKKEDVISFWNDDPTHVIWLNDDTYPIQDLNVYPETARLDDLLIYNKTGIKIRSDIYGNEFYFVKSVYPKRKADAAHIAAPAATTTVCITGAEYYDGLFFDTLLTAISSAEYRTSGTLYSSVTGMYDTFILANDGTDEILGRTSCTNGEADGFNAPLTEFSCTTIFTNALSCGSVSAVSAIDCGSFKNHPGTGTDLMSMNFQETTVPYFVIDTTAIYTNNATKFESTSLNNFATTPIPLFQQQYVNAGEIYVRNVATQLVEPLSTVFVNVFNKHTNGWTDGSATGNTKSNILSTSNIVDFDIVESTIYIQTSAETVTEKYKFEDKVFKVDASSKTLVLSS